MVALVDHFGDEATAGRAPVNLLTDAKVVADLLQCFVDFISDAFNRCIHMRLVHLLPLEHRKDIVHVALGSVSLNDFCCFVDQHYPGHSVELDPFVDDHAVLDAVALQITDIDGRHPAGIVREQEQIEKDLLLPFENTAIHPLDPLNGVVRQGLGCSEPRLDPPFEWHECRQVHSVDALVLSFGADSTQDFEFYLYSPIVAADGSPLLFINSKFSQELLIDISKHVFRKITMVFGLNKTAKRFLEVSVFFGRTFAHQYPAVLEPFLMTKAINDFIDHLGYSGITATNFLLFIVIVAEFIGYPMPFFGIPFLSHFQIF